MNIKFGQIYIELEGEAFIVIGYYRNREDKVRLMYNNCKVVLDSLRILEEELADGTIKEG